MISSSFLRLRGNQGLITLWPRLTVLILVAPPAAIFEEPHRAGRTPRRPALFILGFCGLDVPRQVALRRSLLIDYQTVEEAPVSSIASNTFTKALRLTVCAVMPNVAGVHAGDEQV